MSANSFKRENRVLTRAEFLEIKKLGRRYNRDSFIAYFFQGEKNKPQLGITVSKKVSKKAVIRNKIKRQLREFFRQNKVLLPVNIKISIIAKKEIRDKKKRNEELRVLFLKTKDD